MSRKLVLKEHLYQQVGKGIEHQIRTEAITRGDKLPSLRMLCQLHGISQSTAMKVYYELEAKGLIESRPQSGYFVSGLLKINPALPDVSRPDGVTDDIAIEDLVEKVFSTTEQEYILLSRSVPSDELLPIAKLNKGLVQAMRDLPGSGTAYGDSKGTEKLRKQIARHTFHLPGLSHEELVTTSGCINAISYAMMAITQPGDIIVVESPVYFGVLQLARSLKLKVIELPTHPQTGIEIDALKHVLETQKVKLCLLVSNFSNPTGSLMPDEHKKEVVRLIQHFNVPLIEDDIYGDVYFGAQRPLTCKSFDESGLVLWCSSVSKTLAPGYRVGWIAPGIFKEKIQRLKLLHCFSSANITEEAVANFLETGRYEHHLRKLRNALQINGINYKRAIQEYFPENTKISRPQGGFVLWVEFDKKIDTIKLYDRAIKHGISIAPGRMFSLQNQFNHCMRLNYGMTWDAKLNDVLKKLGQLAQKI